MANEASYQLTEKFVIEPHTGKAFTLKRFQILRIIDIEGTQVVDLTSFVTQNTQEYLSSPRSIDLNGKIYFNTGDQLYSDQSNPMWTILKDTVGNHCFLFAPCDQKMFEISYGATGPHPNCFDNLRISLSPFGIQTAQIFIPFNIFMNFELTNQGEIKIQPPSSKAGDFIDLRAEKDLIVGLSACSAYKANNYTFSQIGVEIYTQ
ncbi:MAG: DUF1989 domain-containing protein [Anaerolineales bacterium]